MKKDEDEELAEILEHFGKYKTYSTREESMWEKITWEIDWNWNNYISAPWRSFKSGIKNLWYWRKVIYEDRWWEGSFLRYIIIHKLEEMEKGWEKAHYCGSEYDQAKIKECLKCLTDINDLEDSGDDNYKEIDKKYEEFGRLMFSKLDHDRVDENDEVRQVNKTTLINLLCD